MRKIILTKGLPGSGKSTWAREYQKKNPNTVLVNKDELRMMLHEGVHSKGREVMVLDLRDSIVIKALEQGHDVVIHDTNFNPTHEAQMRRIAGMLPWKGRCEVVIQDFTNVPLEECIRRDLQRPASVGEKVIRDMWKQFLRPAPAVYTPPKDGIPAIICDLDGTLALMNGRDPYDASTCISDLPNQPVIDIVKKYSSVVYVSGRQDKDRSQTMAWLRKYELPAGELFMRKTGDMRRDYIVKREIFDEHIRDTYRILFVLDDRNQVVEMWRSLGLTCLQVAEGDF